MRPGGSPVVLDTSVVSLPMRDADEAAYYREEMRGLRAVISLQSREARVRNERERAGRKLNTADAWIAATAIMLACPLASHDADFSDIPNLELIRAPSP